MLRRVLGEVAILIGMGLATGLSSAIERGWGSRSAIDEVLDRPHRAQILADVVEVSICQFRVLIVGHQRMSALDPCSSGVMFGAVAGAGSSLSTSPPLNSSPSSR